MSEIVDFEIGPGLGQTLSRELRPRRGRKPQKPRQKPEEKKRRNSPGVGRIALVSTEERMTLRARLDDGYPLFFGGYGGWEDEPRPGQVSATVFRGASAPQLKLKLILGDWDLDLTDSKRDKNWVTGCERAMHMLDHFARLPVDAPRQERPTLLRIRGHVPHFNRRWFVQEIEWGEVDLLRGTRVRAFATVTLRMHVPVELLKRRDRIARRTKPHTVKEGEDLTKIVAREVANGKAEIAPARTFVIELNRLDRSARLKKGQRIKLPVGSWWKTALNESRANRAASQAASSLAAAVAAAATDLAARLGR
ncbi:hypothetical protein VSS74_25135 [Conexibacter stalactiti]|uniref:LysM domain-containing protein n=1 Tax=Conexibacter stalactiti TaxID=1940611 RepID=A0ABU4HWP7_9ACTN|nr:hypothetical protein [Conexibacter stalactiti]MDW5597660.1 hypothetical protein [Conexibacter stalactiti]MEC5038302.1 hypothetical protein [Conexibacter stalactiti]